MTRRMALRLAATRTNELHVHSLQSSGPGVPAARRKYRVLLTGPDPVLGGFPCPIYVISDSILGEGLDFIARFRLEDFTLVL